MAPLQSTPHDQLVARIHRFTQLPAEMPWIEFKVNSATSGPDIAKYVCALGNSATLHDEQAGFLIWGISDSRDIVGTTFDWQTAKGKGNEDLLPWLTRVVTPSPNLTFESAVINGNNVVLLRVPAARTSPYSYDKSRYFRKGSYTKDLLDFPSDERALWQKINQFEFETSNVAEGLEPEEVSEYLSEEAFFANRTEIPASTGQSFLDRLRESKAVTYSHELGWCIPAWSALMYARSISAFPLLHSLAPRVMHFRDASRTNILREWTIDEGYALGFPRIMELFATIRPGGESIDTSGRRVETPVLPTVAFREVLANALMHQDLEARGSSLTIEIFSDHVDVSNPGAPLVSPQRFIDSTSVTRNPHLGEALRLAKFVEKRGSGWDRIVESLEAAHFPPALIRTNGATTVTLSAYRPFALMSQEEKEEAVYQHACLNVLENRPVTNSSVRRRFGLKDSQAGQTTRLIKATEDAGLIKPYDRTAGARSLRYVPFWASSIN
ncbi:RNA-binding domain-containing protein [Corynebacterium phoceense]|uniref:RNA-binding domain-containing protein n=1 Tax=Corynebacterium phoceense TaxID=1686286 RepID=UPI000839BED7|nr:RNA-binding domain-containing protein [Corynebacterium phoceense]MBF9010264.1 putative DNA binding domain-containing protein [Corynebacterium phoceense]